jgi:hypothetical protein
MLRPRLLLATIASAVCVLAAIALAIDSVPRWVTPERTAPNFLDGVFMPTTELVPEHATTELLVERRASLVSRLLREERIRGERGVAASLFALLLGAGLAHAAIATTVGWRELIGIALLLPGMAGLAAWKMLGRDHRIGAAVLCALALLAFYAERAHRRRQFGESRGHGPPWGEGDVAQPDDHHGHAGGDHDGHGDL